MKENDLDRRNLLVEELRRRLVELHARDDDDFGPFTAWDWAASVLLALVIPYLIVWWFSP